MSTTRKEASDHEFISLVRACLGLEPIKQTHGRDVTVAVKKARAARKRDGVKEEPVIWDTHTSLLTHGNRHIPRCKGVE